MGADAFARLRRIAKKHRRFRSGRLAGVARRLRLSDSLACQSRGNLSHHRMDMDVMTAIALHDGYRLALALFSPCPRPKQEAATF